MRTPTHRATLITLIIACSFLSACGGSGSSATTGPGPSSTVSTTPSTFTISGNVSGLASNKQVTLLENGGNPAQVSSNTGFTFAGSVPENSSYVVTVGSQPAGQICTVSNSTGAGVVANVSNVAVSCSTVSYTVSGTIAGLANGQTVTLLNNGSDPTFVSANGPLSFSVPVSYNSSYAVTVAAQPNGQTCSVTNGSGAGVVANITNVVVNCSIKTFTISGTVSGLASDQVTLINNNSDPITVNNGQFSFDVPIADRGGYSVSVATQPVGGKTCTVNNGIGGNVIANITNVAVICSESTYTISGTVSGLNPGEQVTLLNNGSNPLTASANGAFSFTTPVAYGGNSTVTVGTQPLTQTCTVNQGSNAAISANINNINVVCAAASPVVV